jgi:hypothetical protein
MKRACGGSAILAGVLGWLVWLAVPSGCLAGAAPRAGQAGARDHGVAGAQAAPPAGPAAPATPGDQATPQATAPPPGAVWFLSAAQERRLRRIGQAAHRWHAALAPLAVAAQQQGDLVLQGELVKLDSLLRQLESGQQMTFAAYVAALAARNQALALWATNSAYLGPGEEQAWQQADAGATELAAAAETGFVFGADLSSGSVVTYAESAPGERRGAAGGDGASADPESTGGAGGTGDAASGEPAPESGGAMPDTPPVATLAEGSGDGVPMPGVGPAAVETSAAVLGSGDAAMAAAASSPGSGWVVIHGGPAAGQVDGPADEAPPAGDVQEQRRPSNLQEPGAGEEAGDEADADADAVGAAPALAWEEICRPWQPGSGGAGRPRFCPLQPAGAENF